MVRPEHFDFNYETAENNHFQKKEKKLSKEKILRNAKNEFDNLYNKLIKNKINVNVFNDRKKVKTTDSVFPNNWISLYQDGSVYVYPMFSENRRKERRFDIIEKLKKQFEIKRVIDMSQCCMDPGVYPRSPHGQFRGICWHPRKNCHDLHLNTHWRTS